jgi:tetratricopeptide (TPR) repeat protein
LVAALGKMQRLSALWRRSEPAKSWTRRAFSKISTRRPRDGGALDLLAVLLLQLGRFAEAEAYLNRALKEQPKYFRGQFLRIGH